MEIPIERNKLATRFQRLYTHICDHSGLVCDTADIARSLLGLAPDWQSTTGVERIAYNHVQLRHAFIISLCFKFDAY